MKDTFEVIVKKYPVFYIVQTTLLALGFHEEKNSDVFKVTIKAQYIGTKQWNRGVESEASYFIERSTIFNEIMFLENGIMVIKKEDIWKLVLLLIKENENGLFSKITDSILHESNVYR